MTKQAPWLAMVTVGLLMLLWIPSASAHEANHGTIKVHDEADADPDMRNEPHVDCDFFVEGFNMDGSGGELVFYSWPPSGNMSEVMRAGWTGVAEEDGDGFHFLEGPFSLDSGHYRVEAFSDEGHPGDHGHFAKAKMFWVECEVTPPECPPTSLLATAEEDSSITVSWSSEGDMVNLYRAEGSGDFEFIGTFAANDTYIDTETTVGTTYTYAVTVTDGTTESGFCAVTEVTAIPVFPTAVATLMAIALAGLGYVAVRRR